MTKTKIQKAKEIFEQEGYKITKETDESKLLDIPELNISVEIEVHDKGKSWDELNLSEREDDLLTAEQCLFLMNSKYAKQLKMDGSSSEDDFFIKQYSELSRKNGYVADFFADSVYSDLSSYWNSDNAYSIRGVRFARKLKRTKK